MLNHVLHPDPVQSKYTSLFELRLRVEWFAFPRSAIPRHTMQGPTTTVNPIGNFLVSCNAFAFRYSVYGKTLSCIELWLFSRAMSTNNGFVAFSMRLTLILMDRHESHEVRIGIDGYIPYLVLLPPGYF